MYVDRSSVGIPLFRYLFFSWFVRSLCIYVCRCFVIFRYVFRVCLFSVFVR